MLACFIPHYLHRLVCISRSFVLRTRREHKTDFCVEAWHDAERAIETLHLLVC